jgi:hypothetical protein
MLILYVDGVKIFHTGVIEKTDDTNLTIFFEYVVDENGIYRKLKAHTVPKWFLSGTYRGYLKCMGHIYEWRNEGMTTIKLEVESCLQCPKVKKSVTVNAGCAYDYTCTVNNKLITGYVEYESEEPKEVPEWCPLKI